VCQSFLPIFWKLFERLNCFVHIAICYSAQKFFFVILGSATPVSGLYQWRKTKDRGKVIPNSVIQALTRVGSNSIPAVFYPFIIPLAGSERFKGLTVSG